MVVDSCLRFLDAVQLGADEFELLEKLLLVEEGRSGMVEEGGEEVLMSCSRMGLKGWLEVGGDGGEAVREEGLVLLGLRVKKRISELQQLREKEEKRNAPRPTRPTPRLLDLP